jgi:hypothetical protein
MLPRRQDLDLALAAAERADELSGGRDALILRTLEEVQRQRGEHRRVEATRDGR